MPRPRLSANEKELRSVGVMLPVEMVQALDELRGEMQARAEGRVVSRSDAIRACIASATGKAKIGIFEKEGATT